MIPPDVIPGRMTLLVTLFLVQISIFNSISAKSPKVECNYNKSARVYQVLDVGSCHNPLEKKFSKTNFNVTAVDLCPSSKSVFKCDFISRCVACVPTRNPYQTLWSGNITSRLPSCESNVLREVL